MRVALYSMAVLGSVLLFVGAIIGASLLGKLMFGKLGLFLPAIVGLLTFSIIIGGDLARKSKP